MSRIAVLGNIAGGKSTLSRRLSETRDLPLFEIDKLYWKPGWSKVPSQIFERDHDDAIGKARWIIDGVGDMASVKKRIDRATELILLDFPLWIHFWRAAERQMAWSHGTLDHPPGGGQGMPPTKRLFELIWEFDREWMPILRQMCEEQERIGKTVTRLTNLDDLEAYSPAD